MRGGLFVYHIDVLSDCQLTGFAFARRLKEKENAMKKKIAVFLSWIMAVTGVMPAAVRAENAAAPEKTSDAIAKISISRERDLMKEEGLTLDEWDEAAAKARQEGLEHALDAQDIVGNDPEALILREEDRVYAIRGGEAFGKVEGPMDAWETAYRLAALLGGSEETDLRLWSRLSVDDETVYCFQEIEDSETVIGSTVKIAVNADNTVSEVFSSLGMESSLTIEEDASETESADAEAPAEEEAGPSRNVTRGEAEEAVLEHLKAEGIETEVLGESTERVILSPYTMEMLTLEDPEEDEEEEDILPEQLLWAVYTPAADEAQAKEYPYLAHYVKLDGTWLYSLPVKQPGDADARCGYRKQAVFEGMVAGEWSGEVKDIAGNTRSITVPVMHDEEKDIWYLGDVNRRIAVADYAAAAYSEAHELNLISSPDNAGWDNEDLYMFYNYIRAWDYYADLGWIGPDGEGTDVIILKGLCMEDGTPFENACSIGLVEGWQMFGYTGYAQDETPLGLVQGLDVMAHEYTHTFTTTVMNANLYENDLGAINEAMSDIMGNIVEYWYEDTEDTVWALGENTGEAIRNMSDPNACGQPEYVWDIFYGPHTDEPADANDNGGVHGNSSLLNRIAALLCLNHGMSIDEASSFWLTAAMGMTSGTDYLQMEELLQWALNTAGFTEYREALAALVSEEKLSLTELPGTIGEGRKVVRLKLPDSEAFDDKNWCMLGLQLNTDTLALLIGALADISAEALADEPDPAKTVEILKALMVSLELDPSDLDRVQFDENGGLAEGSEEVIRDLLQTAGKKLSTNYMTWREAGSEDMVMIIRDMPTVYMLFNLQDSGNTIAGGAILLGSKWFDLGGLLGIFNAEESGETTEDEATGAFWGNLLKLAFTIFTSRLESRLSGNDAAEAEGYLPSAGLEKIELTE